MTAQEQPEAPSGSPAVSVVLTTFNRSALVLPAINSVLEQTLGDFELIVVDDCSTDDTADVVGGIRDPRVSLVRHETNLGLADARNSGISRARGRYLCFLDDDDEWRTDKLAVQMAAFEAAAGRPEVLVYSQARVDDGVSSDVRPQRGPKPREPMSEYLMCGEGVIAPSSVMLSRASVRGALFDPGQRRFEDYTLYLQLEQRGFRFELVEQPLVTWHVDITRPRLSRTVGLQEATEWLDSWESRITPRARRAFLAREVAPFLPAKGNRWWILRTICDAVLSGSISLQEGLKSLLKALLPPSAVLRLRRLLPRSRFG